MQKQIIPSRFNAGVIVFLVATAFLAARARVEASGAWTPAAVGSPALGGSAQEATCPPATDCPAFTVSGAGLGIGGTSDQFMFLHQRLAGDGVVTMRLVSLAGVATMEAGLMVRESLSASSAHASILMGSTGVAVRSRLTTDGDTASIPSVGGAWLRLERAGSSVVASVSNDGTGWNVVATQSLSLPGTVYVGIVVSSRSAAALATATVSAMSVASATPTLPDGWTSADVGAARSSGGASYSKSKGSFVATSAAGGFSRRVDGFRFVYARVRGDAKLSARVVASHGPAGRQAGIVLRTTLDPGSEGIALVADDAGVVMISRAENGGTSVLTRVASLPTPVFLQLDRRGASVSVAYSTDGVKWKTVASASLSLGAELYAGLVLAAGPRESFAAAAFDRMSLVSVAANAPPTVSLTSPTAGEVFAEDKSVTLSATASDPDDLVARVDFSVNGAKIASDASSPYAASWKPSLPGVYTVVAVATDSDGAVTVSSPAAITIVPKGSPPPPPPDPPGGPGKPWRLVFDAPLDHATVDHYILEIYVTKTGVPVAALDLGKPALAADGTCVADVNSLVAALPAGFFDLVVRAVAASGSTPSPRYQFKK